MLHGILLILVPLLDNLRITEQFFQLFEPFFDTLEFIQHDSTVPVDALIAEATKALRPATPKTDPRFLTGAPHENRLLPLRCNNLILSEKTPPDVALFFLELLVFFAEALDTTGRVHQLLLAGEKWMTLGTNFDRDPLFGGSHFESGPAGTLDGRIFVVRVNIWFHNNFNSLN
jgi:hypothetical protein